MCTSGVMWSWLPWRGGCRPRRARWPHVVGTEQPYFRAACDMVVSPLTQSRISPSTSSRHEFRSPAISTSRLPGLVVARHLHAVDDPCGIALADQPGDEDPPPAVPCAIFVAGGHDQIGRASCGERG